MPEIRPFHGLRYNLGQVGSLSDVVAPPYDVIDPPLQDQLYQRHPANVIRLILNRDEPGDTPQAKYQRAARLLENWESEGLLEREQRPALYVYHQQFQHDGQTLVRRGFLCRTRLERFGEGTIYPHEETHASAKEDRLRLTRACRANLSPVFGLYPDPSNRAQEVMEQVIAGQAPFEAVDHLGVIHRMWPVHDDRAIGLAAGELSGKPLFIADGHHRYETACNYRDELAAEGPLEADHPANFVLMMCVSMDDPGMVVLPTHRLFRGLPAIDSQQLARQLEGCFQVDVLGEGPELAHRAWEQIAASGDQGTLGIYTRADRGWTLARLTPEGRDRMADVAGDHSRDWQSLGVAILHRLIMEGLLQMTAYPKPTYVHQVEELVDGLTDYPDQYSLAALVMPATLRHIRAMSEHGERMPAKSTYFYPKLLSGLVIHSLE